MLPRQSIGITIDSVKKTDAQDFANLMPRPGWQSGPGWLGSGQLSRKACAPRAEGSIAGTAVVRQCTDDSDRDN